ncbi:MAG: bacillithiol biosynthesis deacetylase BshB1 [Saprospiraceae bacterium]
MKLDILAIGVHPDDVELSCAGTILKQKALGNKVGILDLTNGELGTRGSRELRLEEGKLASEILEISVRENCNLADGFFEINQESIMRIIPFIRKYQPDIVLANAKSDRHPDHGRAAKLIADACFYAGLQKIYTTDELGNAQDRWRPKAVYHYIQDEFLEPDFVVDISQFMEQKIEAIKAFKSQFFDPQSNELDSPISGADFWELIYGKARMFGRSISAEFAEGFQVNRPLGVDDLMKMR